MAALAIQEIDQDGLVPAFVAAAAGGDTVISGQGAYIEVINGDTTATTVTLVTPGTVAGDLAIADRAVSVVNATRVKIAVGSLYRDPATGRAALTYSKVTALTIGSFRAPVSD